MHMLCITPPPVAGSTMRTFITRTLLVYDFGLPLSVGEAECAVVRATCLFGAVLCWSGRVVFPAILAWELEKSAVVWSESLEGLLNADRFPRVCLVSSVIRAVLSILLEAWKSMELLFHGALYHMCILWEQYIFTYYTRLREGKSVVSVDLILLKARNAVSDKLVDASIPVTISASPLFKYLLLKSIMDELKRGISSAVTIREDAALWLYQRAINAV